ncbi:MAG: hypothetical protein LBQ34_04480 [Alphaproteobacteria bacterium]|jgi:hypothetical protein|nr:hypothetical protein [Alphaproteobacteria bacterium]
MNKKEDYLDDEFEIEREDFLNPAMKDMDSRNNVSKLKKPKKTNGEQFISLSSKPSLRRKMGSLESNEAVSMIVRGFVFIFMFLISLFGIFLIFKTPYYSMYSQKEPIILKENAALANNPFAKSPQELQNSIVMAEPENTKVPTGVLSKKEVVDEDAMLQREFENSRNQNKQDTALTQLLKNDVVESNNNEVVDTPAPASTPKPPVVKSSPAPQNPAPTPITPKVAEQTTWLVTIYSTPRQDEMGERLLRLKNTYKNALSGATFYFVENKPTGVDAGSPTNYRISVAKTTAGIAYPSFNSNAEAKSFCANLKSQGLDCFVSTLPKSVLPGAIIK